MIKLHENIVGLEPQYWQPLEKNRPEGKGVNKIFSTKPSTIWRKKTPASISFILADYFMSAFQIHIESLRSMTK